MAYFPLSQIQTNLYTDGTEYETSDGKAYTGYYFKVSTGKLYTGRTPQDSPNLDLFVQKINQIDPENQENNLDQYLVNPALQSGDSDPEINPDLLDAVFIYDEYLELAPEPTQTLLPYYLPVYPTSQDYSNGEFRRYFSKKRNELRYIEINKVQYDKLITQDPQIAWQLYKPFFLTWQLTGDKQTVAKTNKNIVELKSKRERLPKLGDYLKHNYLKYYQE